MQPAVALAHAAIHATYGLRVLAVLEATRLTGVARNLVEYARLAERDLTGPPLALSLALIRRAGAIGGAPDRVRMAAEDACVPVETVVERFRYDRKVIDELRRVDAVVQPDIIETHHTKSHCLLALSGLWRHRTWIAFHHGYTQTDLKVCAYNQVDRWSLRHAAHVITTNEPFAAELVRRGVAPSRVTVLHNGVRERAVSALAIGQARRALHLREGERVVLTVGRLSHEKGQEHLLRGFAQASAARCGTRLLLAGEGPDREPLVRLAARLGILDRVTFAGYIPDIAPLYGLADLFVLPSLTEGSPNALLEAMASGLPVVATRVGGVPEIAQDNVTALLVPASEARMMADAMDALLADPSRAARLGAAARRSVLRRYTPERRAATLSNLYAALTPACQSSKAASA